MEQPPLFGSAFRAHFLFGEKYLSMNHGSFGAFPRSVQTAQRSFQLAMESAPDQFLRYDAYDHSLKARKRIAQLLNTSPDECVFVQNATLGINTVLRNLLPALALEREKEGEIKSNNGNDCVIYFDTIYGAIEKTLFSIRETLPSLHIRKVERYSFPCTHEDIILALLETIAEAENDGLVVRVCLFETITSVPAARFPFEKITKLCREREFFSVIDGAHGVGQIHLDLAELDPDFFVSNCHKWLYTPRGCAVLYVPKRNQHHIRTTLPTSWGFVPLPELTPDPASARLLENEPGEDVQDQDQVQDQNVAKDDAAESNRFTGLFSYVGTADTTAYYCVPAALGFRESKCGGEQAIYTYILDVAQRGAELLAKRLGTEVMDVAVPGTGGEGVVEVGEMRKCAMANVLLPFITSSESATDFPPASTSASTTFPPVPVSLADLPVHASWLTETLIKEYHTGATVFTYASRMWLRVSGQIYLDLADFEVFATTLMEILERVRNGDSLAKQKRPGGTT